VRKLFTSVIVLGLSTVASTLVSLIRNKLLAVMLGPAGVGLVAQLVGVQNLAVGIVPLGMQTGALRYIAMYRASEPERLARFVSTATRLFFVLSLAAMAVMLLLLHPLTVWATDSPRYMLFLVPPLLAIPFLVQTQTWLTFVQAGLDVRAYSRATVTTSVVGLLILVPLLLAFRLPGASMHLFAVAALGYLIARVTASRTMNPQLRASVRAARFDPGTARALFHFGAANVLPFALTMTFPFILRAQIVQDLGLGHNGLYQALFAISMQYLAIPLNAMVAYSFPRISQLREVEAINLEVNHAVRVSVLFSVAGILGILLTRDVIVTLLFSDRFIPALPLFPVQMVGDFLKAVCFAIQLPLLPQGRYAARNVLALFQYGAFAAVFFAVPPERRLEGAVWGHTASWAIHLLTHWVYLARVNRFRFSPENRRLLLLSAIAVVAVAALPFPGRLWRWVGAAISLGWLLLSVRRHELAQVVGEATARLRAYGAARDEG
jgi:PST family polysaccharide transporter